MPNPTQKDIARHAGVSPSAVSAALRGLPNIPWETREKVLRSAEELGYQAGSAFSALAKYRGSATPHQHTGTIGYLATKDKQPYRIPNHADWLTFQGLQERADQCGYRIEVIDLVDKQPSEEALTRQLVEAGIMALVVPKIDSPEETPQLDWSRFAAIEIGHGIATQFLNRISPDQFDTTRQALHNVALNGYHRPGLIMRRDILLSLEEWPLAAWRIACRVEGLTDSIPPFSPEISHPSPEASFAEWLHVHRPDVLLSNLPLSADLFRTAAGQWESHQAPFALLGRKPGQDFYAGIVEPLREIGHLAADLLIAQVQRGTSGLPGNPTMTLLRGTWHNGESLPPVTTNPAGPRAQPGMRGQAP